MKKVREELSMKQTKKLTWRQREFLEKEYHIDTVGVRLVEETKEYIKVQMMSGDIKTFSKEV